MLFRVLRTPNISDTPVTISSRHGGLEEDLDDPAPEEGLEAEEEGQDFAEGQEEGDSEAHTHRPLGPYEFVGPVPEGHVWPEEPDEPLIGDESGSGQPPEEEPAEPEPEAEIVEESPAASALEIERLVEERLAEFETRFQREKEEAYKSGFEDGKAEGTREGREQSVLEVDRLCAMIDALRVQWDSINKGHDAVIIDLAVSVASRIIGASVEVSQDTVIRAVQDSLGYLTDKSRVIIRVHPEDLAIVREHRSQWLESLESLERLVIEGSPTITRGGCVIESPVGDVDAQIEERLERMRIALIEAIRGQEDNLDRLPDNPSASGSVAEDDGDEVDLSSDTLIGVDEEPPDLASQMDEPSSDTDRPDPGDQESDGSASGEDTESDEPDDRENPPETPDVT